MQARLGSHTWALRGASPKPARRRDTHHLGRVAPSPGHSAGGGRALRGATGYTQLQARGLRYNRGAGDSKTRGAVVPPCFPRQQALNNHRLLHRYKSKILYYNFHREMGQNTIWEGKRRAIWVKNIERKMFEVKLVYFVTKDKSFLSLSWLILCGWFTGLKPSGSFWIAYLLRLCLISVN